MNKMIFERSTSHEAGQTCVVIVARIKMYTHSSSVTVTFTFDARDDNIKNEQIVANK